MAKAILEEFETPANRTHGSVRSQEFTGTGKEFREATFGIDQPVTYWNSSASEYTFLEFAYLTRTAPGFWRYEFLKRAIDIVVSASMLIVFSPLLLMLGVITKLYDGGPMFFSQTRIGRFGRPFRCYKLRTMVMNADALKCSLTKQNDHGSSITFKMRSDPRITPLGRFLRKTSLDEFPQLVNVLLGQMSMVGPRPAVPTEVAKYSARDRHRLMVKPGLTCVWQVSGRGDISFQGQVEMDLQYIERRDLALDCSLILRTIPAVLSTRGAY